MTKNTLILLLLATMLSSSLTNTIQAKVAYFSNTEVVFENGAGWQETMAKINCTTANSLQAKESFQLNNNIILDDTVGVARTFIDRVFIGAIMPFAQGTLPGGWIECDGRTIDLSATAPQENCVYQELANRIGTRWGGSQTGTGPNGEFIGTFTIPDLRGEFLRGANDMQDTETPESASNRDENTRFNSSARTLTSSSKIVGTYQNAQQTPHDHNLNFDAPQVENIEEDHTHTIPGSNLFNPLTHIWTDHNNTSLFSDSLQTAGSAENMDHSHSFTVPEQQTATNAQPHSESRPQNAAVVYGIRY